MGWLGESPPPAWVPDLSGAIAGPRESSSSVQLERDFKSGVTGIGKRASICRRASLIAALIGSPRWADHELESIAADQGDASALVAAFLRYGEDLFPRIAGSFAFAILDGASGSAVLAIDRMGIETMCYARTGSALVFATDLDALKTYPGYVGHIDSQALFNYLFFHMVPAPGTIYSGTFKLLPGQCIIVHGTSVEPRFYWRMPYRDGGPVDLGSLAARFLSAAREGVRRSAAEPASTATFLSGGTDSSTVTALMAEIRSPADAYSIGFDAEGYDEMAYARIAARHFGARHHTYYVTPDDVLQAVPVIAATYDEPFGNASAVPTYYCASLAHGEGVQMMLAGDGGDELFGGNARYAKQKVFELYWSLPSALRRAVIEPIALHLPLLDRLRIGRKMRSYVEQARVPLPDRLESYNFLLRAALSDIFEPDFLAAIDPVQPFSLQREVYERAGSRSPVNRMMHLDLKITLADNDLRKVSRMCRAAGVEVAYPLLDDDVVALSAELPPDQKVKGLELRHFFKQSLSRVLPPEIIAKSKHGFGLPFGRWAAEHAGLGQLARDSLSDFRSRRILKPRYIAQILDGHRGEDAAYFGVMIWVVMILQHWLQAHSHGRA
jgi:asparagine synthase (glutamine-hydrolysing)